MFELCQGWDRAPLRLSSTRHYEPEEIQAMCKRTLKPYWICVGDQKGETIQITSDVELWLACRIASIYHSSIALDAPRDDGFQHEMACIEAEFYCTNQQKTTGSDEEKA